VTTPSPAGRIGSAPAERWPLTVLGRVLAPAGVRLLTVGGPIPTPSTRGPTRTGGPPTAPTGSS